MQQRYSFGQDTLPEMDGGVLEQKLGRAMFDVAKSVLLSDDVRKTGKVTLEMTISRIADQQVNVVHKLSYKELLPNGDQTINNASHTPLFVHTSGKLSVFQEKQEDLFKPQTQETR